MESRSLRSVLLRLALAAALGTPGLAQTDTPSLAFDAPLGHPLEVAPSGERLYAVNRPDARLSVFRLTDPARPVMLREIRVGLEPVSVRARTEDEVWVVNWLSDSVSVVSIREGRVVDTLTVVDEPGDVVFAGEPQRAFVTASARNEVHVFDAATRELVDVVPIRGRDPRALAVAPDGQSVYVVATRSGNGTTLVPHDLAPPVSTGLRTGLDIVPLQGIIVAQDDSAFVDDALMPQRDEDLFVIDASSLAVTTAVTGVGTNLFGLDVDPRDGRVYVANTDANNLVRFEPHLKGRVVSHRVTRVDPGQWVVDAIHDLHASDSAGWGTSTDPLQRALADPTDVLVDAERDRLYVAAQGTDRIGVLSASGQVLTRVELSDAHGSDVDSRTKRGTRALALHPGNSTLYAYNALSSTLSVVSLEPLRLLRELPVGFDPTPAQEKAGRGFLYDAKQSSNGTASCITCHVDLEWDALAWDLGDPDGEIVPKPSGQVFPFATDLTEYSPLKGPMTTQFLRGLKGNGPFHWRGDRPELRDFQTGFTKLLGGPGLADDEWDDLEAYVDSLQFPPNPRQNLDRSYDAGDGGSNAVDGEAAFIDRYISVGLMIPITCQICHQLPVGSVNQVLARRFSVETDRMDQFKIPSLRSVYRRSNPMDEDGYHLSGFGLLHDGQARTAAEIVTLGKLSRWPDDEVDDIAVFVDAFDTGTAPILGHQVELNAQTVEDPQVLARLDLLEARAAAGDCDVVAEGRFEGVRRGFVYRVSGGGYLPDDPSLPGHPRAALEQRARAGAARLRFTAVPPGAGERFGIDRDADGVRDGVDGVSPYGAATPGCDGPAELFANAAPRIGDQDFTLALGDVDPTGQVLVALAAAPATGEFHLGVDLLVDPDSLLVLPATRDPSGFPLLTLQIPDADGLAGRTVFAQALYEDACGSAGWAATQGLRLTVQR